MPVSMSRSNEEPARRVTELWKTWVDPLAAAFEDLEAQQELETLQQRLRGQQPTIGSPETRGARGRNP